MFNFSKKIAIAASFVAIYSGQFAAFASESLDGTGNESKQQVVASGSGIDPVNKLPADVMKLILAKASQETNPGHLASVNSSWRNMMRDNAYYPTILNGDNLNPFMKTCMQIWGQNEVMRRFSNAVLRYTDPNTKAVKDLPFSNLANPFKGTFDLSACGRSSEDIVITTDIDRFFTVGGENAWKVVILINPRHMVEQAIVSQEHPFTPLMKSWNGVQAPAGIFWRWGSRNNLTEFDYLVTSSLKEISRENLSMNWDKSVRGVSCDDAVRLRVGGGGGGHGWFFMFVL